MEFLKALKRLVPEPLRLLYHYAFGHFAAFVYRYPSRHMVVIGVTGTKGKTTTANFIWACLEAAGCRAGLIGSANIRIHNREMLNPYHMTMPGRFTLQHLLADMRKAGCTHCVVETTSEGTKQWRHLGIWYDAAVFTNLFPEHLESHRGSIEVYRSMKERMFAQLERYPHKKIGGKPVQKILVVNADSPEAPHFIKYKADRVATFGFSECADYTVERIVQEGFTTHFEVRGTQYRIHLAGRENAANAAAAIALCDVLQIPQDAMVRGLDRLGGVPGRMERIDAGQLFTVIVDHAHEPQSLTFLLETVRHLRSTAAGKIIIVFGATGGGRDKAKRPVMGKIAAERADVIVLTNEDPYDDDPQEIMEHIAHGAEEAGKQRGHTLYLIEDRREAIRKALSCADKDDIVVVAGKGSEQSIIIKGKHMPWDDRSIVREELRAMGYPVLP